MSEKSSPSSNSSDLPTIDPAVATTIADQLKVLRQSIKAALPYTGGVYAVKPEDLVVFYDIEGENNARCVAFTFMFP